MSNKKCAISHLRSQIHKLESISSNQTHVWTITTKNYLDEYFSENSEQVKFFQPSYWNTQSKWSESTFLSQKTKAKEFLLECIEIISNKGIYKEPKKNFLSKIPDSLLVLMLSVIGSVSFLIGKYTSDVRNIQQKQEIKTLNKTIDSLKKSTIFLSIPTDKKTNKSQKDTISKK